MKILGEVQQDDDVHRYCPHCWSQKIVSYSRDGKEYYRCGDCGYDGSRLIEIYPQLRFQILEDKELLHYSVGCVIQWEQKFLLFRRRLFPFKYTLVAGHWDLSDPTPESAVAREVREEVGIEVSPQNPIFVETLNEPCRRGADYHKWHLYRVTVSENKVVMSEEADIVGWYSPSEISDLELTIPTEHFFRKLELIT